jgi:hypothetical protein
MGMTDEELIERLRDVHIRDPIPKFAATRIEALAADVAGWISNAQAADGWASEAKCKLEVSEAKLAKVVEALKMVVYMSNTDDCEGYHSALADANAVLAELEKPE